MDFLFFVSEYLESEYFLFLPPPLKENAEGVLQQFISEMQKMDPSFPYLNNTHVFEDVLLKKMSQLQLDVEVKKQIPNLLIEFFEFLGSSGKFPEAKNWKLEIESIQPKFVAQFRQDGSVKKESFRKKGSDTGRNDPCPCGSGKKFKKCCLPLIS